MSETERPSLRMASLPAKRIAVALLIAVVLAGSIYLFSQRHVYRVSIRPGEAAYVELEVPMQRFARSKSFAKERGLPVACTVSGSGDDDSGLRVSVVDTGHTVQRLQARLRVEVERGASPGTSRRSIDFTIDGQGGWPTATVVVTVLRTDRS